MKKVLLYYLFTTLVLPLSGVLLALQSSTPDSYSASECTRYCHGGGGCGHEAVLPDFITSDSGIYGGVIRGLFRLGDQIAALTGITHYQGYGAANLLIFCLAVPMAHFVLMFLSIILSRRS